MKKLSKNKIEILELFKKDIFLSKTIRELSLLLKKPYPKVYEAVKEMKEEDILRLKKIGPALLCELLLSKEAISVLSFIEEQEALSRPMPSMKKILEFKEFADDILLVTGSYAKGRQSAKSDIDLAIITKDAPQKKQSLMENMTLTFLPEIHPVSFSYNDFIDMLLSKEENFGKEVFRHHLLFRNSERYYLLVREAVEHGFGNKNLS